MKITKNSPPPVTPPPATYTLSDISQEEMDMLRWFIAATSSAAAQRFLNKTSQFEGNTYAPDKCFI